MLELDKVIELDCNPTISLPVEEVRDPEMSPNVLEPSPFEKLLFDKVTSKRLLMAALAMAALAVFANSLSGDLVHDDLWQIGKNSMLGQWDWQAITRPFTHDHWAAIRPDQAEGQVDSLYYRPIFGLFFIIGHVFAGSNPA